MRILPILHVGVLDGVLHKVDNDPKVQEAALKSLNVGKKTPYSSKEYTYFFKVIFETLITVLENVWGNYSSTNIEFVKIGDPLVKEYAFLSTIFHDLGCMFIFVRVQNLNFDKFKALDGDHSRMIREWAEMRGKYQDNLAALKTFCFTTGVKEIELPYILKRFIDSSIKNSEFYKNQVLESTAKKQIVAEGYLKCSDLVLDINSATIQYKNNKSINITPDTNTIKFLQLLLQNINTVVSYSDLSDSIFGVGHNKSGLKDIAKELQYIKRDLVEFLIKEVDIPKNIISQIIVNVPHKGYKMLRG